MKKKVLCCLLALCVCLTMAPGMAWADSENASAEPAENTAATLNIADGSIVISETGYKQGDAAETPWEDSSNKVLAITGTATTANTITVTGGEPKLIFKDLNITRTNEASSGNPVLNIKSSAAIETETNSSIDSSTTTVNDKNIRHNLVSVAAGAILTVEGTGKLELKGSMNRDVVTGKGTLRVKSGELAISVTSNAIGITSNTEITGGTLAVTAIGDRRASAVINEALTLSGGILDVEANGEERGGAVKTTTFTMSGGTIKKVLEKGNDASINADTANITGGNVNGYYTGEVSGRTLAKLYFYDSTNGEAVKGEDVQITEGETSWHAYTDETDGTVTTYTAADTDKLSVTYRNEASLEVARQMSGSGAVYLVGVTCECTQESAAITWSGETSVEVYRGKEERTFDVVPALKANADCKSPVHPGYDGLTVTLEVLVNGAAVSNAADYASYDKDSGQLTVKKQSADYTVKLTAASTNGKLRAEREITVTVRENYAFDLLEGTVTVAADTADSAKTVYTQGEATYTATAGETVVLTGKGKTDNYLEITSGTAQVLLDSVQIESKTEKNFYIKDNLSGTIRVKGGTLNLTLQGENVLKATKRTYQETLCGQLIYVGSVDEPTNPNAAVLNINCAEETCSGENCPHSLRLYTDNSRSAVIGGARYPIADDQNYNTPEATDAALKPQAGTIRIQGGQVLIPSTENRGANTCIGTPNASGVYHYNIEISGGFVEVQTSSGAEGVGIGMGRSNEFDSEVNISITDGTVIATAGGIYRDSSAFCPVAIGAGYNAKGKLNITIGSETTAPTVKAKCAGGVAIGKSVYEHTAGSEHDLELVLKILSGTVDAEGQVGIGYFICDGESREGSDQILITGGTVNAKGTLVGIGEAQHYEKDGSHDPGNLEITIGGTAKVSASGTNVGIGCDAPLSGASIDIKITGDAEVKAEANETDGVAIGSTRSERADDSYQVDNTISIDTSKDLTLKAANPLGSATEATINGPFSFNVEGEDGNNQTITVPSGATATVKDDTITLPRGTTVTDGNGNTTTLPNGGTLLPDGTVKKPSSGSGSGGFVPAGPTETPLDKAKAEANEALANDAAANKYDDAQQAEIKSILDKAAADIKEAKTEDEVKAIKDAAQAEIDKVLTSEENAQIKALADVSKDVFKAKSKYSKLRGKKAVKVTWNVPKGMKLDGYEIWRSTKKNSGYGKKAYFTTTKTSYKNSKGLVKGKTYYYKVRGFVEINGERYYTGFSTKAHRVIR